MNSWGLSTLLLVLSIASVQSDVCTDPLCEKLESFRSVYAFAKAYDVEAYLNSTQKHEQAVRLKEALTFISTRMTHDECVFQVSIHEIAARVMPMALPCTQTETNDESILAIIAFSLAIGIFVWFLFWGIVYIYNVTRMSQQKSK